MDAQASREDEPQWASSFAKTMVMALLAHVFLPIQQVFTSTPAIGAAFEVVEQTEHGLEG